MTATKRPPANPVWRQGPPPAIGWWPASNRRDKTAIRWWDGETWSYPARPNHPALRAGRIAGIKWGSTNIEWTDPWW